MGEYAKLKGTGERIKIGTCEDMYYLRADQADQVWAQSGNVNPIKDRGEIRFRFPFPNEDHIAPGSFDDHNHGVTVYDVEPPAELEHYSVQFSSNSPTGYLVSLPCPESEAGKTAAYKVHRNGFAGAVQVVQQRWINSELVTVLRCACGAKWRLPTLDDALPVAVYFERQATLEADRDNAHAARFNIEMARRVLAGYHADHLLTVEG